MIDEEIQEVRAIRHAISQECGHDVRKLAAYLRKVEAEMRKTGEFQFATSSAKKSRSSAKRPTRENRQRHAGPPFGDIQ